MEGRRSHPQKQAWPFWPLGLPFLSGTGHQPVADSTAGGCAGTGPFHGLRSLSTALRGGGETIDPCASARSTVLATTSNAAARRSPISL